MIEKHIGKFRNLLQKAERLTKCIKQVIEADDVIIISNKESRISISGHTQSTAMNLFLLGKAIGIAYMVDKDIEPKPDLQEYVNQPIKVALNHIERNSK